VTDDLRPGAIVEVTWFPDDGDAFDAGMLDGQAGTMTTFRDPDQPFRPPMPAFILAAEVAGDGRSAMVRLRLDKPADDAG
jgi:hypothetical protein